ncbi:MAG TPA: cupin domain-containing protein [Caulobacteraceae bacterium]|nr:cupin domain-containing protein [Caulobacteraceae bacterium]
MDIHSVDWDALPWERVRAGVERKAFSGDGATLSLNRLQPGHEPRPHSHPHEQIVYILAGQIEFHIGDAVKRLSAGGLLVVPPNVEHWGEVVGDEPVLNLDVFTPKRAEYAA